MIPVLLILAVEALLLFLGQRKIFGGIYGTFGKLPAYLLAAPGTVLHEAAHFIMCKLLGVRTGEVQLFSPRQMKDGTITLGFVQHEETDPLRGALVAIAPLLLVPPLLVGVSILLFGVDFISDPIGVMKHNQWWKIPIWLCMVMSAGQGAFPSTGDKVGVFGAVSLTLLCGAAAYFVPADILQRGLEIACVVLALPAMSAAFCLAALGSTGWRRGRSG